MKVKEILSSEIARKTICILLLLTIALLSVFVISKPATSPESYRSTIKSIDEKKATVMGLTATAVITSTALSAVPGDTTTPIANQIMEISSYLLIVVCVLVLEKSLLTVMGFLSFNVLIPAACVLLGVYTFLKKEKFKILAVKIIVFALVIVAIIPFSLKICDLIYEVNESTIEQATSEIDQNIEQTENQNDKSWFNKLVDKFKSFKNEIEEKAKQVLNNFIDAIAIFIITYCAIPVIIVLIVIWFIKFLFGITIPIPKGNKLPKLIKHNINNTTQKLIKTNETNKSNELTEV